MYIDGRKNTQIDEAYLLKGAAHDQLICPPH
jgi:hypothetical protein